MTKKMEYTATFSDGKVLTRKSHRQYAAAYRWFGTWTLDGRAVQGAGFARSHELAAKALRNATSWDGLKLAFAEVANAEVAGPKLLDDVLNGRA